VVHFGLTLLFGGIALVGTLMPWDGVASGRWPGLTREWSWVLVPLLLVGGLLVLTKRRGASGWILAAVVWVGCFPIWQVVHAPHRLVESMAVRLGQADSAHVLARVDMAVGKLTDQADAPDQGDCPRAFLGAADAWLAPGYWLALIGAGALLLAALASPRHGSPGWSLAGYAVSGCMAVMIGWLSVSSWLLTRRWDKALDDLANPQASRGQLVRAVHFVESYPAALLNPLFRTLVMRADAPLAASLRDDLTWQSKTWPLTQAAELLSRLPAPDSQASSRVALRRMWWGPTLRVWMKTADKLGAHADVGRLSERLGDAKTGALWAFTAAVRVGRWDQAERQAGLLIKDPAYSRYLTSLQNVRGTLLNHFGEETQARELWLASFATDPTNNDPAIHGLGAVGP
jgi:hypothetical protein